MKQSEYLVQNKFLSNFLGSLKELRKANELLDVTLACEDETIEAHKVVLSACSSFFRAVFSKTKQKHPFIYLKGVHHKDLVALLDYIYTGETQLPAEDIDRFLEVGKELEIKGLTNEGKFETNEEGFDITDDTDQLDADFEFHNSQTSFEVKKEAEESKDEEQLQSEINMKMEKMKDEKGLSMWKCKDCGKVVRNKHKMKMHVEIHLEGFSHKCVHCDTVRKTRGSLQAHMSLLHRGL